MSNVSIARDHFKRIVAKIDGCIKEDITDEILDEILKTNLKNIPENEQKILFGSLIVLDDQLQEQSTPIDLINLMNKMLQNLVSFFKLLAPNMKPPDDNNNDEVQDVEKQD
jgi:hypothetical protein